jgi:serine/threonine protein phosphatase PrpC
MIRLEHTSVPVVALSHTGMKRKENEDRYGVASFSLGADGPSPVLLAVLCDGIGGHRAGEVAAEMAVNLVSSTIAASDAGNPKNILVDAIQSASEAIREQALLDPAQAGMGATCACVWVIGQRLYTASVGDTRIYLMRGEYIQRISTDHTWVQEALDHGTLRPDHIYGHPNAHIIRRYLGSPTPPEVDLRLRLTGSESDEEAEFNQGMFLLAGDRLLLTTDGLTDLVSDAEILNAFRLYSDGEGGQALIDLANSRGGHDNISLITFEMTPEAAGQERTAATPVRKGAPARPVWRWAGFSCVGLLLTAIVVAVLGLWWLLGGSPDGNPPVADTPTAPPQTATVMQATKPAATPSASAAPKASPTVAPLPLDIGPTLTPWPTNTKAP